MSAETWTQEAAPEVAPVRPGEELPWERLATYVASRLGLDHEMTVLQFPNGSANLTYLLTFDQGRFVLRRPPFGVIAPGAHDMRREFRVLSRLWSDYDRAPRAHLFCDDHDVIGSDFVVSVSPRLTPSPTCTSSTPFTAGWPSWASRPAFSSVSWPAGASAGTSWPRRSTTR